MVNVGSFKITASLVERLIEEKNKLRDKVRSKLTAKEASQALRDSHARREPIACGMTIHTGIGCNFGCVYCYVPDMGFPMKPRPYPLTGLQLVYALLSNKYIVPGINGTLLAFGSVTEPFMSETIERALEYLKSVSTWLNNPIQLSTKAFISEELAKNLKSIIPLETSFLISITTLRHASKLEPNAPSPSMRLKSIENLSSQGFHVSLFLRPIIPGITDLELEEIISAAASAGARGIIPGTLRITTGILRRLSSLGIDTTNILRRAPRKPRRSREQIPIYVGDIKQRVKRLAEKYNLKLYPSSCSANIESHRLACWICKWGPCGAPEKLPRISIQDAAEIVEILAGIKPIKIAIEKKSITIVLDRRRLSFKRREVLYHWLSTLTKRRLYVKFV